MIQQLVFQNSVITFLGASQFKILILRDDPSSMADVYATIKVLNQDKLTSNIYIIVNSVEKNRGTFIFKQLQSITKKFLNVELNFLGSIQHDEVFSTLTRSGKPVCPITNSNQSQGDFISLSQKIIKFPNDNKITGGVQFFLQSLISKKALNMKDTSLYEKNKNPDQESLVLNNLNLVKELLFI